MKQNLHVCILLVILFSFGFSKIQAEPLRVLGIGNSFTVDALGQHMQPLLEAEGREAIFGYPYRGGTVLSEHDQWSTRTDTMPYNYRKFSVGVQASPGVGAANMTIAMEDEPWDWVIIQSDHDSAGICKSYVPYMEHLISYVHAHCSNPNVKIGFYMTWAYDATSTYNAFNLYNKNQQLMYDSIIAATKMVMARHPEVKALIPCGTAVQNARTSFIGERMNRDGYHLHYNHGRYVASLIWYEVLFGKNATEVEWQPSTITAYCADMCRHAAHAAVLNPYEVTSLAEDYGEEEEDPIVPGTESHLKRISVNGMNVPLIDDQTTYNVQVDYTLTPKTTLYAYPVDSKAELNITDAYGADIEKDPAKPGYFPLTAPAKGATVSYTIRVISEAMGSDETIYHLNLTGAEANTLTYPISSREDMEGFAWAVNNGSTAINAEVTANFSMNHTKQDCWMTPAGSKEAPYTGTFDGKGYTIADVNLYAVDNELSTYTFIGLFGYIKNATIRNVHITGVGSDESYFNRPSSGTDDTQNKAYSILCGCIESSTIQDCSVDMPIFTNVSGAVGLIAGRNADVSGAPASVIERCYVQGNWRVRHKGIYAGILGYGYNCVIRNCYSLCSMALQQDKGARMGGILGYGKTSSSRTIKLENCYSYGKLTPFEGGSVASYQGAIAAVFNGTSVTATNCWYLEGCAPKAFGQQDNTQTATAATATQFADGTVATALGDAFKQGGAYPILESPVTTGVETLQPGNSDPGTSKIIRDGQLLIRRDGQLYNIQGQLCK